MASVPRQAPLLATGAHLWGPYRRARPGRDRGSARRAALGRRLPPFARLQFVVLLATGGPLIAQRRGDGPGRVPHDGRGRWVWGAARGASHARPRGTGVAARGRSGENLGAGRASPCVFRRHSPLRQDDDPRPWTCLLYTSDAADDLTRVDLGG